MSDHSVLGPSAAHRWLTCPGSVGLIESAFPDGEPDTSTPYSIEGTQAHEVAALEVARRFKLQAKATLDRKVREWKKQVPADKHDEMMGHARDYADLIESMDEGPGKPLILLEQRVYPGVTGVYGTADAILVTGGVLRVIDYKYGAGVPVAAEGNPQLQLYALGAYNLVQDLMGDALGEIEVVEMTIYQPRVENHTRQATTTIDQLIQWRDQEVAPQAALALSRDAYLNPTPEACRFCPVAGRCEARAAKVTRQDFGDPRLLTLDQLADYLHRLPEIEAWITAVRAEALRLAYQENQTIPGWKVVRSRGKRTVRDEAAAIEALVRAGLDRDKVSRLRLAPLAQLDKEAGGKEALADILGDLMTIPLGKEGLAPESDPRPAINRLADAQNDFAE